MKKWFTNYGHILLRNIASLITLIISIVIVLLVTFGEFRDAIFISSVLFLNIIVGIIQEVRAKRALEKLRALTIQKVIRLRGDNEKEIILIDMIKTGDKLFLQLGDQIPCDGIVLETFSLEVNESLLTGESDYIRKKEKDEIFGGSIIVSGSAIIEVTKLPIDSLISKMTDKIKKYDYKLSPIQKSTVNFIRYMSYFLIGIVAFVIIKDLFWHQNILSIVIEIAALSGTLVPEGLVLAITILFSYGAVKMFQSKVLLQEINATEGLSRIKNLCVDKTGTLTENSIHVEKLLPLNNFSENQIGDFIIGYISAINDTTETAKALQTYFESSKRFSGEIISLLPFSSERKYGIAQLTMNENNCTIVVGAPDILINYLESDDEKNWLMTQIDQYSRQGKRLLLVSLNKSNNTNKLSENEKIIPVGLFVLQNPLRPGTKEIIDFFQEREVAVRVISGDNPKTVQAIASQAGIKNTDQIIIGDDIEKMDEITLKEKSKDCHLFARVKPHHKERLIEVFKEDGFTAMIGDGANDALAIKKSDLGIAMFEGASATRQIAKVILVNNQFSALPMGVRLADSIITTIELVASIFFNKVAASLTLLVILSFFGYSFPVSPRNMTLVNYFTIGLPILFWSIFPAIKKRNIRDTSFLKKVAPISLFNGILVAFTSAVICLIMLSLGKKQFMDDFTVITYISLGFWFFVNVPMAFDIEIPKKQKMHLFFISIAVLIVLSGIFIVLPISNFFGVERIPFKLLVYGFVIILITAFIQYFTLKNKTIEKILKKISPKLIINLE